MPSPIANGAWLGVRKPASTSRYARSCADGRPRPPYSVGPVIQPKPASNTSWRHALAASTSASSSLARLLVEQADPVGALAPLRCAPPRAGAPGRVEEALGFGAEVVDRDGVTHDQRSSTRWRRAIVRDGRETMST